MTTVTQNATSSRPSDLHDPTISFAGKTALVTGASRGIGAAIAQAFGAAGADVVLLARSTEELNQLARAIRRMGTTALPVTCDVTDAEAVDAACARVLQEMGSVDVLVNNAGGPLFHAPALTLRNSGWRRALDLNLTSVFQFSRNIGANMIAHGGGSIINIASVVGLRAVPLVVPYSVAKAGVVSLTQGLASEWGPYGVRVNVICPGFINTELNRPFFGNPEFSAVAVETAPLGRWGEVADVVSAVLWLASPASAYITGAAIPIDGGLVFGVRAGWIDSFRRSAEFPVAE